MSKSECQLGFSHVDFLFSLTSIDFGSDIKLQGVSAALAFKVEATAVVCIYILFLQKYEF